jgi:hypothetical protein
MQIRPADAHAAVAQQYLAVSELVVRLANVFDPNVATAVKT